MTNFQKLQDAYTRVGWIKENTFRDEDELSHVAEYIQKLIAEFIVDNEPKKKGTFNIWDYVANDDRRPVMNGVFHDRRRAQRRCIRIVQSRICRHGHRICDLADVRQ